jgi:hypothetical protein
MNADAMGYAQLEPTVEPTGTANGALPGAEIRKIGDDMFSILLERVKMDECWDQGREMQMGQGCISTPTGPSC